MKKLATICLSVVISISAIGQSKIDSLLHELDKAKKIMKIPINMQIANEYAFMGDYQSALKHNQQALDIALTTKYKDFHALAYDIVGGSYEMMHEYEKAIEHYEKSIKAEQSLKKPDDWNIANTYGNLGYCHRKLSESEKAIEYYNQSIQLFTEMNELESAAFDINQLGLVYSDMGDSEKAMEYYKKTLSIYKLTGNESGIAISYNNIGSIHLNNGKTKEAYQLFEQALAINQKIENAKGVSSCYAKIAQIHKENEEFEKAIDYYLKSMKINEENNHYEELADNYSNLGLIYAYQLKTYKAIAYHTKSLEINRKINDKKGIANDLNNLAMAYWQDYDDENGIKHFNESIAMYEEIRSNAPLKLRREYLAQILGAYQVLYTTYIEQNKYAEAFEINEQSRSRVLNEQLAKKGKTIDPKPLKDIQNEFGDKQCVILYTIDNLDVSGLVVSNTEINYFEKHKGDFVTEMLSIPQVKSAVASTLDFEELKLFKKFTSNEEFYGIEALYETYFNALVTYYRSLLTELNPRNKPIAEKIASSFYEILIQPFENQLAERKEIILIPDGILGYLPFETLINSDKQYLVENYDIRYTQSIGILETIKEREYKHRNLNVLAVGGAIHNESSYEADMALVDWDSFPEKDITKGAVKNVFSEQQIQNIRKDVELAIDQKRGISEEFKKLGYGKWSNLSGSLLELKEMRDILPNTTIIKGYEASESNLKKLSDNGDLKDYAVIHLSTHGITIPEIPEMSSLVLNQYNDPSKQNGEDGYLRMGEIEALDLKADFVNLSACETGLGKIYGGEGVVGLTQSFLVAGANSISVSLWEVADKSTAKFMVEVYRLVHEENMEYYQAINEVKRKFINGDYGFMWKNPYYWAPFVFYGN